MGKHAQESHIWAGSYTLHGVIPNPPPPLEATTLKSNMRRINNNYYDDEPSEHAIIVHPHPLLFGPGILHLCNVILVYAHITPVHTYTCVRVS